MPAPLMLPDAWIGPVEAAALTDKSDAAPVVGRGVDTEGTAGVEVFFVRVEILVLMVAGSGPGPGLKGYDGLKSPS